ncbi:hypothetical protein HYN59_15480 [Flavobacterium album]|uniref:Secretion system C-terminal sorting domain-containing protein n=1 Tax=Flavobacterium album TaxID=2175091 RepID=A0A2S1R1K3_9FLAO|nr:T9SS type A sorting domain-containing protein [Flavobacterium album]AWH86421.1 hypothetical protein HYN59_15480 [Flavobacterium album]
MMKRITLPLFLACLSQLGIAQCDQAFTVPYTSTFENATVPALPDCMTTTYFAFASSEVFESIAGPVSGFSGKLLAYDTYTGSQGGGAMQPTIGADLYTNEVHLVQGVQYVVSYRYGNSDATKTIGRFGVQLQQPGASYYDDLATHLSITGATPVTHTTEAFTVPETGDYWIHFDVQSFENQGLFYIDDISLTVQGSMGVGENLLSAVSAFPNPVSDRLSVSNPTQIDKIEMYTLTGQMLCSEAVNAMNHTIDMSSLSSGMYMLHIYSGSRVEKMKVYKK